MNSSISDCKAIIREKQEVTPGVYKYRFSAPEISTTAVPGQFVQIDVSGSTIPVTRRPFTLDNTIPASGEIEIIFQVAGRGTLLLSEAEKGDTLKILGPLGAGYRLSSGRWLLIGGGMGVAGFPFLARKVEGGICIAGASTSRLLVVKDLEGFEMKFSTEDGSLGKKGLITDLLEENVGKTEFENIALCGPRIMMCEVVRNLPQEILPIVQVSTESNMGCGWGVCGGCVIPVIDEEGLNCGYRKCCTDGPVMPASVIDWKRWRE